MSKKTYNFVFTRYHELTPSKRFIFCSLMPDYVGSGYIDNHYKVTGFKTLREAKTFRLGFEALIGCYNIFDAYIEVAK